MSCGGTLELGHRDADGVGEDRLCIGAAEKQEILKSVTAGDTVDAEDLEAFSLRYELVEQKMTVIGSGDGELKFIQCARDDSDVLGRISEVGYGVVDVRGGDRGVQRCGGGYIGVEWVIWCGGSHR